MVSIRQSLSELESAVRYRDYAVECYQSAVQSMAEYAIDVDPEVSRPYRERLTSLAARLASDRSDAALTESKAELRNQLRAYRDQAAAYLNRLREELSAKATSLQKILESMSAGDDDHEVRLGRTLKQLRELSATEQAAAVREQLNGAAAQLENSLTELKRQHQLTVAQFLMEVQMLHERIQSLEVSVAFDRATRLASRREMESRLVEALSGGQPVLLALLRIRNLQTLMKTYSPAIEEDLLGAFAKRLRSCLRPEDVPGRWDDDGFTILLSGGKSEAIAFSRRVAEHASGTYALGHEGKLIRPTLQIDTGVVDCTADDTKSRVIARIEDFFNGRR